MSEYRIASRLIRSERRTGEGRIRRTSLRSDDRLYTIPMMEAMQRLGMAA